MVDGAANRRQEHKEHMHDTQRRRRTVHERGLGLERLPSRRPSRRPSQSRPHRR